MLCLTLCQCSTKVLCLPMLDVSRVMPKSSESETEFKRQQDRNTLDSITFIQGTFRYERGASQQLSSTLICLLVVHTLPPTLIRSPSFNVFLLILLQGGQPLPQFLHMLSTLTRSFYIASFALAATVRGDSAARWLASCCSVLWPLPQSTALALLPSCILL